MLLYIANKKQRTADQSQLAASPHRTNRNEVRRVYAYRYSRQQCTVSLRLNRNNNYHRAVLVNAQLTPQ